MCVDVCMHMSVCVQTCKYVYVCVHVTVYVLHAHEYMDVCAHVEVGARALIIFLCHSQPCFEAGSPTELEAHYSTRLPGQLDPGISHSPPRVPAFYMGARDLNPGPHACRASALTH